uniref:C2H2-type domain-containing protein n=1 Tax=Brassica campestris TaxID=3711 RepID=A0A3P6CSB8_BRACM|nr:unnamed protein product [Brassica rapa]
MNLSCIDFVMFSSRGQHDEGNMSRPSWKRERSNNLINLSPNEDEELANCLVLLSNSGDHYNSGGHHNKHGHGKGKSIKKQKTSQAFQCKACKKVFTSHQALGGHRASHKKVKGCFATQNKEEEEDEDEYKEEDEEEEEEEEEDKATAADYNNIITRKRSNAHECTICHRVFSSGQALGGHKRCHWLTPSSYFHMTPLHDSSSVARSQMLEQPSLDLNLTCQEYSVDPTVMSVWRDDGGNNHNATSPDSWLKLASVTSLVGSHLLHSPSLCLVPQTSLYVLCCQHPPAHNVKTFMDGDLFTSSTPSSASLRCFFPFHPYCPPILTCLEMNIEDFLMFCWELRQVPSEIGVKPILLLTGVDESSSLMSISFQERSHFAPFAITSHIQQVLNMLYPLLSCSHLCNYAVDLKKEMPSSETYGLGIVGLSFIINAVDGVFTSISSEFRHQRGSPTCPNSHVRFILDLAQSHPLLEDCSPIALQQKANQTSSCRGHERTFAPECKNCLMLPYSVASSKGIFPKSPLKRQSSRGAQLKSLGDFDRSWKDFKMFINQPATTKPGICSHFHTMTEYSEELLESGFINTLWYRYGNIGIKSLLLAICHAFSPSLVKLFCCFTGVMMARSSSPSSLVHHCPLKLSFQDKFMKMAEKDRQGRERSPGPREIAIHFLLSGENLFTTVPLFKSFAPNCENFGKSKRHDLCSQLWDKLPQLRSPL